MAKPRIHVAVSLIAGGDVVLPDGPARHVALVLRLREGAPLTLFDGAGHEAQATLIEVVRKRVVARIEQVSAGSGESPLRGKRSFGDVVDAPRQADHFTS